jgi:hypothetical protein
MAVDLDVAAFAQLGRQWPGLDEAHGAQPAINSGVVCHGSIVARPMLAELEETLGA